MPRKVLREVKQILDTKTSFYNKHAHNGSKVVSELWGREGLGFCLNFKRTLPQTNWYCTLVGSWACIPSGNKEKNYPMSQSVIYIIFPPNTKNKKWASLDNSSCFPPILPTFRNKSFPNFVITFGSGSYNIERATESNKTKQNILDFYHIPKPIFYFSNAELKLFCKENSWNFIGQ